jgi:CheY-like chemotaxis protein
MSETALKSKNHFSDFIVNDSVRKIELISFFALFCLLSAVILLSFRLILAAGIIIIIAACAGIILIRRISGLIYDLRSNLNDINKSNQKQSDYISDFSHRIREPLNNLVIAGGILLDSDLPKKQHELIETFVASTSNMVTAVNELTMQSAASLSYGTRKLIRFNVYSTLQNTIELYRLKDKPGIDFKLIRDESENFEYIGDPIIVKQIFLDVFNTIEMQIPHERKKVSITIKRGRSAGDSGFVDFELKVPNEIDFNRDNNVADNLAAKLTASANGSFRQEPAQDNTILHISLPLNNVLPEIKQQMASPKIEELTQKTRVRKDLKDIKVLLVEDNPINQKITLLTLKPLVSIIDTAANGKEALDKFGSSSYDLILMDIQMPVMNGLVAVEKIRALEISTNAHIPIIAITANAMLGDREKCIYAGVDDYISKPFQPSALIEKIKVFFS